MVGVIANAAGVFIGGILGFLGRKIIPADWNDPFMKAMGLVVVYIGVSGCLCGKNILVMSMSILLGVAIGMILKLDEKVTWIGDTVEARLDRNGGSSNFSEGFVTCSILLCSGAMCVVGPLNAGLQGDITVLITKTTLDTFVAVMMAVTMGMGVMFASVSVFVYEGAIFFLATFLAPYLSEEVINEMACVGYVLIIGLGLNMTGATNLRVMNYMPGIFLPIVFYPVYHFISQYIPLGLS